MQTVSSVYDDEFDSPQLQLFRKFSESKRKLRKNVDKFWKRERHLGNFERNSKSVILHEECTIVICSATSPSARPSRKAEIQKLAKTKLFKEKIQNHCDGYKRNK